MYFCAELQAVISIQLHTIPHPTIAAGSRLSM
jgi:hypothetical protein